jgi:hypothetical protein
MRMSDAVKIAGIAILGIIVLKFVAKRVPALAPVAEQL